MNGELSAGDMITVNAERCGGEPGGWQLVKVVACGEMTYAAAGNLLSDLYAAGSDGMLVSACHLLEHSGGNDTAPVVLLVFEAGEQLFAEWHDVREPDPPCTICHPVLAELEAS